MTKGGNEVPAALIIGGATLIGSGMSFGWALMGAGFGMWLVG
jgi:hypothetical protein